MTCADYVIVGAGSAGCAIAYRLTQAGHSVCVIEAGGTDAGPFIQMPGALSYPMNMKRYDWGYSSEPEPHLGGRRLACPRGRVIGGSSSINGMIYVRGHAKDYDTWAQMGASGWSYADVLPYFKRQETWNSGNHGGDPSWRGHDGPLHVGRAKRANPLIQAFVQAGGEAGYPLTTDYNGHQQEGFGPYDATIHNGTRWSAAKAYLRPAQATGLCRLIKAYAHKIDITQGVASGVHTSAGLVRARHEVIISASAINSPKLLMLSGIGPGAHLQDHGIDCIADRPGVGKNLQDHLEVYVQYAINQPVSLAKYWNIWGKAWVGALWLFGGIGPGASNQFESAGFIRSQPGVSYPDIQFHFLPIAVRYDGKSSVSGHGMQAHVGPMRSPSRGEVTLTSSDPAHAPKIVFNYMSTPKDWDDFRKCIHLTRELFEQPALKHFVTQEIQPGADMVSDSDIDAFIRDHAESAYHPCGTCKMGRRDDPMAVVDEKTNVIGVDNLRVADSSIFPQITNGNLNAPSIMVGEKASDHILNRPPLPRANVRPWMHPNWQTQQR